MRRLPLAALAAVLVLAAPADAYHPGKHSQRWRTLHAADRLCSQKRPTACIKFAAVKHRQSYPAMRRVAKCESTLNPYARNGIHRGLFQFNYPGTWSTTPYRRFSPWSARWNSLAAAWMWKAGRKREWVCQ